MIALGQDPINQNIKVQEVYCYLEKKRQTIDDDFDCIDMDYIEML